MMNFDTLRENKIAISVCSKTGRNHIKHSTENQDSFLYEVRSNEDVFMAIADGVSSSKYSKEGSLMAVKVIDTLLDEIINNHIQPEDVDAIRRFVVRRWKAEFSGEWNDYATTLNFVIVHRNCCLIGQIGDGLIVLEVDEKPFVLSNIEEFYTTETFALGESVLKSSFKVMVIPIEKSLSIIMATDGIGKEVDIETYQGLREYLSELQMKEKSEIKMELLSWFDTLDKKNGDDKTIGILVWEV